jgi:hypothetical protein
MVGLLGEAEAMRVIAEVYAPTFTPALVDSDRLWGLLTITAYGVLPFAIVTIAYMFVRDRRWQPVSAVAVLALPLYLTAGAIIFSWPVAVTAPAAVVLGAFASWLSVARLSPVFRWVSASLMVLAALLSWSASVLLNRLDTVSFVGG